ncbi:hypothetical protein [Geoalkalibacter halelectricus]|uniref:hypothetical protein n=1 Tax=Geoalkalibacter halelectricus TaxID=2847045 RepID=UPI00266ED84D|nr:hypothetical protein [Geoalkalibacter halelectricus]
MEKIKDMDKKSAKDKGVAGDMTYIDVDKLRKAARQCSCPDLLQAVAQALDREHLAAWARAEGSEKAYSAFGSEAVKYWEKAQELNANGCQCNTEKAATSFSGVGWSLLRILRLIADGYKVSFVTDEESAEVQVHVDGAPTPMSWPVAATSEFAEGICFFLQAGAREGSDYE